MRKSKPTEAEIIESATVAIEHILRMPILEAHRKALVSGTLWFITEARGKYSTRYWSRAAKDNPSSKLQHEHVFTRKDLTARLMAEPQKAREILQSAIACVVTVDEHRRLAEAERQDRSLRGWDRYKAAGIEVVDSDLDSQTS
jgi:hypothetical protein